jgi:hypothetical protein
VTTTRVKKKRKRRNRRKKIADLRQSIVGTQDESKRQKLIAKLYRVSKGAPVETK